MSTFAKRKKRCDLCALLAFCPYSCPYKPISKQSQKQEPQVTYGEASGQNTEPANKEMTMTDQQLIDDLTAAKAYMQEHGRCTKGPSTEDGKVCIAVAVVQSLKDAQNGFFGKAESNRAHAMFDAIDKVCPQPDDRTITRRDFVTYNEDSRVTDEDVFSLWDKALAEAGGLT